MIKCPYESPELKDHCVITNSVCSFEGEKLDEAPNPWKIYCLLNHGMGGPGTIAEGLSLEHKLAILACHNDDAFDLLKEKIATDEYDYNIKIKKMDRNDPKFKETNTGFCGIVSGGTENYVPLTLATFAARGSKYGIEVINLLMPHTTEENIKISLDQMLIQSSCTSDVVLCIYANKLNSSIVKGNSGRGLSRSVDIRKCNKCSKYLSVDKLRICQTCNHMDETKIIKDEDLVCSDCKA